MSDHPLEVGGRIHHWRADRTPNQNHPSFHGTVLEVHPQRDGSYEYLVQRDAPLCSDGPNEPTWWPSYHTRATTKVLSVKPTAPVPPLPGLSPGVHPQFPDRKDAWFR